MNDLPREARQRLNWPLRLTWAGMVAERLTRAFWPIWTILFTFIALLAFGAQDWMPLELLWATVVLGLAGLLWALVRGIRSFHWPRRDEALARIDGTLPGRPIAALRDSQALGAADAGSTAVWQAHLARMAERLRLVRPTRPDLNLAPRDPFALRHVALIALVMAAIFGSLWKVAEAPGMTAPGMGVAGADGPAWEGWAEPPAYTGRPSLYLNVVEAAAVDLPEGTKFTLRLYGAPEDMGVEETVSGLPPAPPPAPTPDLPADQAAGQVPAATLPSPSVRAVEFTALQSGTVTITGSGGRAWTINVLPDDGPAVTLSGDTLREADGRMTQIFAATDDYAVTGGHARFTLDLPAVERSYGLASAPEPRDPLVYDLPLPITGSRADFTESFVDDASKHPWANLPVTMTFEVTDGREQAGQSETRKLLLPGRRFFDPVAAAVIEMRRDLLWTRENGARVSQILHAMTNRPEGLIRNSRAYLMLRVAIHRLDAGLTAGPLAPELRDEVAEALWGVAELIEDGGLSNALDRMQQAQERLSEAIRNGASPEEIQKLMDDLRAATDDYIRQLAQNMERKGADEPNRQAENSQRITGDQLQQMMDEIQRLMQEGRMAEAQELLNQLQQMMQNLRVTEGQPGEGADGQGGQTMDDLRQTLRDQQELSDDAFRNLQNGQGRPQGEEGQQEGQGGPQGQGQPQPGQGQGDGQSNGRGDGMGQGQDGTGQEGSDQGGQSLADRQRALRDGLSQQEGALPGAPSDQRETARRSLGEAGQAMEEAERSLREGDLAGALDDQAEALEKLREGMRELNEALAQNAPQAGQAARSSGRNEGTRPMPQDPLGRTTGENGGIGTDKHLLQGNDVYRRARDLLDEIRRRAADQDRPTPERDYLKRLLDRF